MTYKDLSGCVKIDNEVILKLSGLKDDRRSLLIYSYLLHISSKTKAVQMDISKLLDLVDIKMSTGSKGSIKNSLDKLVDLGLISMYEDKRLIKGIILEEQVKKPKDTFWVKANQSISEMNFTLIPYYVIDDIIFSDGNEKADDLFAVVAYICLKSERREGVAPIMWSGRNTMTKDVHMTGRKLTRVIDELLRLEIIYYKRANLTGGRSNYVYGLYDSKDDVDVAVSIAESNNIIDKRIKFKDVLDNVIDIVDGEFLIDIKLSNFFDRHKIDCNIGVADETNRFCQKHGHAKLMNVLGEHNPEIYNADNKNGAYRSVLRRNY